MTPAETRKNHFERLNNYRHSAEYAQAVGSPQGDLPSLLGQRWEIDQEIYDEFLGILPPLGWKDGAFFMCEFTFDDITARYSKEGDKFYCEFARYPQKAASAEVPAASGRDVAPEPRKPIIIEVRGGVVQDVLNVPDGYEVDIRDYDDLAAAPAPAVHQAPTETPWGRANSSREIAPGIVHYETASHGGFYVSPARVALMPKPLRDFKPFAGQGWYEEDCDWAVVTVAFPQFFAMEDSARALATLKGWKPELYAELGRDGRGGPGA